MVKFRLHILAAERNLLKIKDLIELTGLDRNTVTFIFQNKAKMISLKTIATLCNKLNCSPGDLFDYTPNEQ